MRAKATSIRRGPVTGPSWACGMNDTSNRSFCGAAGCCAACIPPTDQANTMAIVALADQAVM